MNRVTYAVLTAIARRTSLGWRLLPAWVRDAWAEAWMDRYRDKRRPR